MPNARVEFGDVHMSIAGAGAAPDRAENISRLAFDQLQLMMDDSAAGIGSGPPVERLNVGPLRVSFDTMDDGEIARATAVEIYRALLGAL